MRTMFSPIPLKTSLAGAFASAKAGVLDRAEFVRPASIGSSVYGAENPMFTIGLHGWMKAVQLRNATVGMGSQTIAFAGRDVDVAYARIDELVSRIEVQLAALSDTKLVCPTVDLIAGMTSLVTNQDRRTSDLNDRRYERFDGLNQT